MNMLKRIINWFMRLFKTYNTTTKENEFVEDIKFSELSYLDSKAKIYSLTSKLDIDNGIFKDSGGNEIYIPNNSIFAFNGIISFIDPVNGYTRVDRFEGSIKRYGGSINVMSSNPVIDYFEGFLNQITILLEDTGGQYLRVKADAGFLDPCEASCILYGTLATI